MLAINLELQRAEAELKQKHARVSEVLDTMRMTDQGEDALRTELPCPTRENSHE